MLPTWLDPALPERLRGCVRARPGPRRAGELTLIVELPEQPPQTIDVYLMAPGRRALTQLGEIGFGYRSDAATIDHRAAAELCVTFARAGAAAAAPQLLAYLREPIESTEYASEPRQSEAPGVDVLLNEYTLIRTGIDGALERLRARSEPIREVEVFLVSACVQDCSFCVYPQVRARGLAHRPSPDAVAGF
jgi:hypothetical protein